MAVGADQVLGQDVRDVLHEPRRHGVLAGEGHLRLLLQGREVDSEQPFIEAHPGLRGAVALRLPRDRLHRDCSFMQLGHDGLPEGQ